MSEVLQAAKARGFPAPLFIHRASVEAGDKFFTARAPDARAISDPEGQLFEAFDIGRGTLLQLLGPRVWWRGLVALLRGHLVGRPTGNEAQMPGAFLVRGREILSAHRARHSGDHPDLVGMLTALDPQAASAASPPAPKKVEQRARKKLEATHRKLLAEARDLQRSGDLRAFAAATERAEEVARQLDASESHGS